MDQVDSETSRQLQPPRDARSVNADAASAESETNGPENTADATQGAEQSKRPNPLRRPHFRTVWLGAFTSSIGGWMEFVGISWIINTITDQPAKWLGLHAAAQLLPMMVLGIPAGVLADRVNRRTLLLVTQAMMMLIAMALTVMAYANWVNLTALMVLTSLMGVVMAFNFPAWQVLTPRLVPREELHEAMVMMGLQFNIARVIGPAIAGVLMGYGGTQVLFLANTISFIAVMFAVWKTPDAPAPQREQKTSVFKETLEGLRFTLGGVGPRAAFIAMTIFGLFAAPLQRMLPLFISVVYYTRTMGKSQQEFRYGVLLACMGVGAVLGVMVMRAMPKWYPKHHLIPVSILISGIAIAGFGATSNPVIGVPCLILAGGGWLISFNSSFAAMQLLVPDRLRGRVLAVCNTAVFGAMAVGPVVTGYLAGRFASSGDESSGTRIALTASGVLMGLAGAAMLIWRAPEVDGIQPGQAGYDRRPGLLRGLTADSHRPSK